MERWRIELLGELRAVSGARVVTRFRTEKTAALLGHLALFKERAHARESLIDLFWPGADREHAGNNLSKSLSSLRAQLEPPGTEAGTILVATRATIQLAPGAIETDVDELRDAVERAGRSRGDERTSALERACALYRGDLLPACFQDWVRGERERLRAAFVRAGRQLAEELAKRGEVHRAIDRALAVLAIDPLCEPAAKDLMALYVRAGEPLAALGCYEDLARRLERELGVAPSDELRKLASELGRTAGSPAPRPAVSVARSEAAATGPTTLLALATPDARRAALLELARKHEGRSLRLEDREAIFAFARPRAAIECAFAARRLLATPEPPRIAIETGEDLERAHALAAAASPGQVLVAEPAAAHLRRDQDLEARTSDLGVYRLAPASAPEHIFQLEEAGSDRSFPALGCECLSSRPGLVELSRFFGREDELRSVSEALGASRLVTITGPGGIGKTRLALEAARFLTPRFGGSVWFASLATIREPGALPGAIAQAAGLAAESDSIEEVARALPARPALLVLDNFEHLVEGGAELVAELLARAGQLACLVTSRFVLGLEGERETPLRPLPVPDVPVERPEELDRFPSVRLLLDRARLVNAAFAVTPANAASIGELVMRLEGIPLALTLAAGSLQVLSPAELLERLGSRLDLPATKKRDAPARHRSLRAAILGSYRLLAPELQKLFATLSVFEGGFTVEAVEVVCAEPLALDRLSELREHSFLQSDPDERRVRLTLLETLREFAHEQLGAEELAALRRRHAEFYAAFVKRVAGELDARSSDALARLDADHANIRAVFEGCAEDPVRGEAALVLAGALFRFWEARHLFAEGRRLTEAALAARPVPTAERASALITAGALALRQGDREATRARLSESVAISRALGATKSLTRTLSLLGTQAYDGGEWGEAEARFAELVVEARASGNTRHLAIALFNTALVRSSRGDYAPALAAGEEALALLGPSDVSRAHLEVLLGDIGRVTGQEARARDLLERAIAFFRESRNDFGLCQALSVLGDLEWRLGDDEAATRRYEEALAKRREGDDGKGSVHALVGLAQLRRTRGDPGTARRLISEATAILSKLGKRYLDLVTLAELAWIDTAERDAPSARIHFGRCLRGLRDLGALGSLVKPLEGRAVLAREEGDLERAVTLWSAVEAHRERLGLPRAARDKAWVESEQRALREALGEDAFARRWSAARALDWQAAVEVAVS